MFRFQESLKYYEDANGFVYKRVNENDKTAYFDCINEPRCLVAARVYKQTQQFRMFGNHIEACPPDEKVKMKIHFEEYLKKAVVDVENAALSVLNVYKQAAEVRYKGIWLPENHRTNFLVVLRRIRSYQKATVGKPKKSRKGQPQAQKCDVATSPMMAADTQHQNAVVLSPPSISSSESVSGNKNRSMATTSGTSCDAATSPMVSNRSTSPSVEVESETSPKPMNDSAALTVLSPPENEIDSAKSKKVNI